MRTHEQLAQEVRDNILQEFPNNVLIGNEINLLKLINRVIELYGQLITKELEEEHK